MFYKAVSNGKIVEVFDENEMQWCRWEPHLKIPLKCKETEDPFGVLARDSSVIFAIREVSDYQVVELQEISEERYIALKEEIDNSRIPDDEAEEEEEEELDRPPTRAELNAMIEDLQGSFEELSTWNEELEECIMELSGVVYA